jgi:ABC-type histidine transport system ATPase subunit
MRRWRRCSASAWASPAGHAELASVIAMAVDLGAHAAEVARTGIESTLRGPIEAARSLVVLMHAGRIHEMGPPDALFGAPQTPELRQFLSALH